MQLRTFRKLKGWTLEETAEKVREAGGRFANVSYSNVSRHERGHRFPDVYMIGRYSEVTDGAVTFADWANLRTNGFAKLFPKSAEGKEVEPA